jgi:hypothetical protein
MFLSEPRFRLTVLTVTYGLRAHGRRFSLRQLNFVMSPLLLLPTPPLCQCRLPTRPCRFAQRKQMVNQAGSIPRKPTLR